MSAGRPRPDADAGERELADGAAAPICPACRIPAIAHKGAWQCGTAAPECSRYGDTLGEVAATLTSYTGGREDLAAARARVLAAGNERRRLEALADQAYRVALDVALEELDRDVDRRLQTAQVARLAGVDRSTIYNELARRQEARDQLGPQDPPPAPAPADTDDLEEVPNA